MTKVQVTFTDIDGLVDMDVEITGYDESSNAQALAKRAVEFIEGIAHHMPETALPAQPTIIVKDHDKPLRLLSA
jgi:hypothetical protein